MTSEKKKHWKKRKKQATATTVAAVASASVLVGGLFASPDELLNGGDDDPLNVSTSAVRETVTMDNGGAGDSGNADDDSEEEQDERRRSAKTGVKEWIWSVPVGVRAVVGVPLWAIGWVIIMGCTALWTAVLSPAAGTILRWVCIALVLLGVFAVLGKTMFPDLSMKKILNKKNFLVLFFGAAFLGIADGVLPTFWPQYERYASVFRCSACALLLAGTALFFARRELKRRRRAAQQTAEHELSLRLSQEQAQQNVLCAVDATR